MLHMEIFYRSVKLPTEKRQCSSALTQAPLLGLEKHLKLNPSYVVNQEDGIFEVALNSAPTDLTEAILQTMIYGVESIARQCPQYVRIQEHRR